MKKLIPEKLRKRFSAYGQRFAKHIFGDWSQLS